MAFTRKQYDQYMSGELTDEDLQAMIDSGEISRDDAAKMAVSKATGKAFGSQTFGVTASGTSEGIFDDIGNVAEGLFDPGADERRAAEQKAEEAIGQAKTGYGQIPEPQQLTWGEDVVPYEVGGPLELKGFDAVSAGPSEWEDLQSAWEDLNVDKTGRGRLNRMGGYFEGLTKDPIDAIAEADYARRQADAEQMRRANTEAAMRELEARGMGGGGQQLLAELSNQQASVGDQYQAGLDVNAAAQARRDFAAGKAGELGMNLWGEDARQAEAKAAGRDRFAGERATGVDARSEADAGRGQEAAKFTAEEGNKGATETWNRTNTVSDKDVDKQNTLYWWNKVGGPQQHFENYMDVTRGVTGAQGGAAGTYMQSGEDEFAWGPWLANQASNITKASGGGS